MSAKEVHIYLSERDRLALRSWADEESRSVTGQVTHIVRQALASRAIEVSTSADLIERIRNATRSGLNPKDRA